MELESLSLESVSSHLLSCFSKAELDSLGKSTRFIQRSSSKLDGLTFLLMNIFESYSTFESSLNDRCDWLEEHFAISMRKQSLDERYNTYAVAFMKQCFLSMLSNLNSQAIKELKSIPFSCIQLTDATSFKIPDQLQSFYKGYRGNGGESVIKLHLNYDLLRGSIADISIGDGSLHDNSYEFGSDEQLIPKGLYLRDLGYYSYDYFEKLMGAGAYFLSRAKTNACFYHKNTLGEYEQLNLLHYLKEESSLCDLPEVYLGSYKKKLKVRLVIDRVPEEVAQQRLAKLEQYASKQKNKTVSEHRKAMCYLNVFITNIPTDQLDASKVRLVYSLRWQIEIMFKIWKSHYQIDQVRKMNIFRFECHLYAKLMAILIDNMLQNEIAFAFREDLDFELSTIKASKFIKKKWKTHEGDHKGEKGTSKMAY